MKAVALILALALITGCNARAVQQASVPVSAHGWEDNVNRFMQYIFVLNQKASGVLHDLKASHLNKELDTMITDTIAELETYREGLQTKLIPYTESSSNPLSQDMQLLVNKLQKDMEDAKERSTEYLGELKTTMEQNSDDVHNRISAYTHKLKKRLDKDTEQIRNTVATYLGELHSRTFQNLDTLKGHVEPYLQQSSDTASKRLSDISSMLKTQTEGLGQQLEITVEGIKTQLEVTAQELRTTLEGKIEELTKLFSPYVAQAQEQFEGIVEAVKESQKKH